MVVRADQRHRLRGEFLVAVPDHLRDRAPAPAGDAARRDQRLSGLRHVVVALLEPLWLSWCGRHIAVGAVGSSPVRMVGDGAAASARPALLPRGVPLRVGCCRCRPCCGRSAMNWPTANSSWSSSMSARACRPWVRTREHALLYDAGARVSADFDLGDAVVVPSLHACGTRTGSADDQPPRRRPCRRPRVGEAGISRYARCYRATRPTRHRVAKPASTGPWDGVRFEVFYPPPYFPDLDNDNSCVLRVVSDMAAHCCRAISAR